MNNGFFSPLYIDFMHKQSSLCTFLESILLRNIWKDHIYCVTSSIFNNMNHIALIISKITFEMQIIIMKRIRVVPFRDNEPTWQHFFYGKQIFIGTGQTIAPRKSHQLLWKNCILLLIIVGNWEHGCSPFLQCCRIGKRFHGLSSLLYVLPNMVAVLWRSKEIWLKELLWYYTNLLFDT